MTAKKKKIEYFRDLWVHKERQPPQTTTAVSTLLSHLINMVNVNEWRRDSSVRCVSGEISIVPASQPAAAVCACEEAESSAAWSQPPSLWTCWDQNLAPADAAGEVRLWQVDAGLV